MPKFERVLLVALVVGVWALVLKPGDTEADYHWAEQGHSHSHSHDCDISGTGYGEVDGTDVYVYQLTGTADCY